MMRWPMRMPGRISFSNSTMLSFWAMAKAVDDHKRKLPPNLLVAVQILINKDLRSKGLSYEFISLMKQIARDKGIKHIALPVRPTQKHLYPLVSMDDYINWTNDKGEPFDAWLRVHKKAGGELISVCSRSMTIRGNVNEWQEWTGLTFQSSGLYTVANALSPVSIDLEHDLGEYIEPNVWFIHTV